jgi:hypothetical protein
MWHKIKTPDEQSAFKKINTWKVTEDALVVCNRNGKYYFKFMIVDLDKNINDAVIFEIDGSRKTVISALTHYELWMSLPREQSLL